MAEAAAFLNPASEAGSLNALYISTGGVLPPFLLGDPLTNHHGAIALSDSTHVDTNTTYKSFQTIDWLHDEDKERFYRKTLQMAARQAAGLRPRWSWAAIGPQARYLYYSVQGWLCLLLIGICCGCLASYVDVVALWFADLRSGYCDFAWWTSKTTCCLLAETIDSCDSWVDWSQAFGLADNGATLASGAFDYFAYVVISVTLAVTACFLVVGYAPYAAGSGIAEVKTILSGFVIRKHLGKWTLGIKCITMPLVVASGLVLGKEGPMVHMAACIGNLMSYLFPKFERNTAKRRTMIAAAATAGVSVAFGAPIGGVLFALEEIAYYFPAKALWRGFFCSLVAATTLQLLDPYHTGELVLFQTTTNPVSGRWGWYEVPVFAFVGVIGGAVGSLFIRANIAWCAVRKHTKLKAYPITEIVVLATVTAIINYTSVFMRMDLIALISQMFTPCEPAAKIGTKQFACVIDASLIAVVGLVLCALTKMALLAFTSGTKVPVGVFVPSIAAGACLGRAVGATFAYVIDKQNPAVCNGHVACIDTMLYALLGGAALLTGVTRITVSCVVIMFEITGDVNFLIPVMITVLVAKWSAAMLCRDSLYGAGIKLSEYPFLDEKRDFDYRATVAEVMRMEQGMEVLLETGNTVGSLEDFLMATRSNGFPVVTADRSIIGYVSRNDLAFVIARALVRARPDIPCVFSELNEDRAPAFVDVRPFMDPTPISIVHSTPFATACDIIRKTGARYMLVTRRGVLAGIVTRKDMLSFIHSREEARARGDKLVAGRY
eukprot:c5401_g1_i1.p1 GENE.c5401_g1_i1~~c5401_g1_i1.p1  ORF type:complete len:776 (+),score=166.70 c5401_g1_i1:130-2457(+)